jgi:TRAP transporter TAXI family solute receptor
LEGNKNNPGAEKLITTLKSPKVYTALAIFLVTLPLALLWINQLWTAYPDQIKIVLGEPGGLYRPISQNLIDQLNANSSSLMEQGVTTHAVESDSVWQSILKLNKNDIDFALYQAGTVPLMVASRGEMQNATIAGLYSQFDDIRFVANLYSEVVHVVVPTDSPITNISQLSGSCVAMGGTDSGTLALTTFLARQLYLHDIEQWSMANTNDPDGDYFNQLLDAFETGEVDAAIFTMGIQANEHISPPILPKLLNSGKFRLIPVPFGKALQQRHLLIGPFTIPKGSYRPDGNNPIPAIDLQTVAVKAKLLTHKSVDPRVVAEITNIILRERFQRNNKLGELFELNRADRISFASRSPEFAVHPGANAIYQPEEFDIGQLEGWEALYSLLASFVIGTFLFIRWYLRRSRLKLEHKLDRWIHLLLDIERSQVALDADPDANDIEQLKTLLDKITKLRIEALSEFSAHELEDDNSVHFFIEMCHYLSNKINMKLSRQRIDLRLREIEKLSAAHVGDKKTAQSD